MFLIHNILFIFFFTKILTKFFIYYVFNRSLPGGVWWFSTARKLVFKPRFPLTRAARRRIIGSWTDRTTPLAKIACSILSQSIVKCLQTYGWIRRAITFGRSLNFPWYLTAWKRLLKPEHSTKIVFPFDVLVSYWIFRILTKEFSSTLD